MRRAMNQTARPALDPAPLSLAVSGEAGDGYSYLLIMRFAVTNLVAFALLGAAWMHGLVGRVIEADSSHLCMGMLELLLVGLAICGWRIAQPSRERTAERRVGKECFSKCSYRWSRKH